MADPITWRNVTGPSLAEAARPLAYAQQSLSGGFDALSQALKDFQVGEEKIWKQQDTDATNAERALIYGAKTPEELAALRASGQIGNTVAANGARIDRAVLDPLADARPGVLQDQQTKGWQFAKDKLFQEELPTISVARQLMANKDWKGAQAEIEKLSPENRATMAAELLKTSMDVGKYDREGTKLDAEIAHWKRADAAAATQAKAHADQVALAGQEALEKRLTGLIGDKLKAAGTVSSSEGSKMVVEELAKVIKDPKELEKATVAVGRLAANPEFANASPSQVLNAVLGSQDSAKGLRWWSNTGDDAEKNLKKIVASDSTSEARARREAAVGLLDQQIEFARRKLNYLPTVPTAPAPGAGGAGSPRPGADAGAGAAPAAPAGQLDKAAAAAAQQVAASQAAAQAAAQAAMTPEQKLAAAEADIRATFAEPKYETPYDRMNRIRNLDNALANARREAADPLIAQDRANAAATWNALKEVNDFAGRGIVDVARFPLYAALRANDAAIVRPLRAAGLDIGYTTPLITPEGVSTSNWAPMITQKLQKARQKAAEKKD